VQEELRNTVKRSRESVRRITGRADFDLRQAEKTRYGCAWRRPMLKHRLTRGEMLLVLAAIMMIGAVAIGAGRRQAAQQAAITLPAGSTGTAVAPAADEQCPMEAAMAAAEAAGSECPLKGTAGVEAAGDCCDKAMRAAGEAGTVQCDKAAMAAGECEAAGSLKAGAAAPMDVAAKTVPEKPSTE
jgi:hypothetical protein